MLIKIWEKRYLSIIINKFGLEEMILKIGKSEATFEKMVDLKQDNMGAPFKTSTSL